MNYRVGGKQAALSFGVFPKLSLAEARKKRDAMRSGAGVSAEGGGLLIALIGRMTTNLEVAS